MIVRNTNPFEYYIIQQLFNDVNVPRCHTENFSYENIFFPFKYTLLLFSWFYFFGHKCKGHNFLGPGAFAPVAPPSTTCLSVTAALELIILSEFYSWHGIDNVSLLIVLLILLLRSCSPASLFWGIVKAGLWFNIDPLMFWKFTHLLLTFSFFSLMLVN